MISRTKEQIKTYGFATVIGLAFVVASLFAALAVYQGNQHRLTNCEQIEILKDQLRPPLFDLRDTQEILRDLGTDPESEQGKRLIERSRKNIARDRALLTPREC